ncbi:hypothetical protein ANRL2_04668 [Anaerolineae bacterium]|nr:hypothetical protein ANRL2_04668 [Anaerolineae bacterium]
MFKLIDAIKRSFETFVEQRDDLIMIVTCSDNDAAMVLKFVQDVEQANGTDLFLLFADDFTDADTYVADAVARLREEHSIASEWLTQHERSPLAPIPENLDDKSISPVRRLGLAMTYARSLIPADGGHRVVWVMFPQAILDRSAYLEFVSAFIPRRGLHPGLRQLRLAFRDQPDTQRFAPTLSSAPRVRIVPLDLGPDAIQQALQEEVEDEELPAELRMQALLQNALIDGAHGRSSDALKQFWVLLGHYQHTGNTILQAVVLNAVGDVYRLGGNLDRAQHFYECAVPPAIESQSVVVFHSAVRNLADLAYAGQRYTEASELYGHASELAGKMLYAEGRITAFQQRGLCQAAQEDYHSAVGSWEAAAALARATEMPQQLQASLKHLITAYEKLKQPDRVAALRAELRDRDRQEHAP